MIDVWFSYSFVQPFYRVCLFYDVLFQSEKRGSLRIKELKASIQLYPMSFLSLWLHEGWHGEYLQWKWLFSLFHLLIIPYYFCLMFLFMPFEQIPCPCSIIALPPKVCYTRGNQTTPARAQCSSLQCWLPAKTCKRKVVHSLPSLGHIVYKQILSNKHSSRGQQRLEMSPGSYRWQKLQTGRSRNITPDWSREWPQ